MIIMAIDPGPEKSGLVRARGIPGSEVQAIYEAEVVNNYTVLANLDNYTFDALLIEEIESYGMPVGKSVFDTCYFSGRFWQAAAGKANIYFIPRREVKLELCNSNRAKDSNVMHALLDIYGPKGTKARPGLVYGFNSHLWPALGLVHTFLKAPDEKKFRK